MTSHSIATPALYTLEGSPPPRRRGGLPAPPPIRDAVIAFRDGAIAYAGPASGWEGDVDERVEGAVVPGFVDCHTHLPFVGWRSDEHAARIAGRTYLDLHGEGGIYRSARMFAEASDEEVLAFSEALAREALRGGTTSLELKTGYGLSVEGELRQARLARELAGRIPQRAVVTLLACHAVPDGWERGEWVDAVCAELIPAAAAEGLADAVDVYVEDIAFSTADLERVAEAARGAGLPLRCHAEQLGHTGAAEVAAGLGARSADHLNHLSPAGVRALGAGRTGAVLLPASTLFLGATPPDTEELLASAAIALATDLNPGTSPTASMAHVIATAAALYRIPAGHALTAATINAAWVLGLDAEAGSLEAGKRADLVVLDAPEFAMVPYRPGHHPVAAVYVAGERVV